MSGPWTTPRDEYFDNLRKCACDIAVKGLEQGSKNKFFADLMEAPLTTDALKQFYDAGGNLDSLFATIHAEQTGPSGGQE